MYRLQLVFVVGACSESKFSPLELLFKMSRNLTRVSISPWPVIRREQARAMWPISDQFLQNLATIWLLLTYPVVAFFWLQQPS